MSITVRADWAALGVAPYITPKTDPDLEWNSEDEEGNWRRIERRWCEKIGPLHLLFGNLQKMRAIARSNIEFENHYLSPCSHIHHFHLIPSFSLPRGFRNVLALHCDDLDRTRHQKIALKILQETVLTQEECQIISEDSAALSELVSAVEKRCDEKNAHQFKKATNGQRLFICFLSALYTVSFCWLPAVFLIITIPLAGIITMAAICYFQKTKKPLPTATSPQVTEAPRRLLLTPKDYAPLFPDSPVFEEEKTANNCDFLTTQISFGEEEAKEWQGLLQKREHLIAYCSLEEGSPLFYHGCHASAAPFGSAAGIVLASWNVTSRKVPGHAIHLTLEATTAREILQSATSYKNKTIIKNKTFFKQVLPILKQFQSKERVHGRAITQNFKITASIEPQEGKKKGLPPIVALTRRVIGEKPANILFTFIPEILESEHRLPAHFFQNTDGFKELSVQLRYGAAKKQILDTIAELEHKQALPDPPLPTYAFALFDRQQEKARRVEEIARLKQQLSEIEKKESKAKTYVL